MPPPDRLELLANQTALTGLDFCYVHPNQTLIDLYFLSDPAATAPAMPNSVDENQIVIRPLGKPLDPPFPTNGLSWEVENGRTVLRLSVPFPGGFETYLLSFADDRLDPRFDTLQFSFKANCDSGLDCRPVPRCCGPDERIDVNIDTTARDFWAMRRALLDFASERWPDWKDRLAADTGVMLAELVAGLADEFAWVGDQIAWETRFDTARTRRALRQFARLVDHELDDGAAATGWLSVECTPGQGGLIDAGAQVTVPSDTGTPVVFEIGGGLADVLAGRQFPVDAAANSFVAYVWDEDPPKMPKGEVGALWPVGRPLPPSCIARGATRLWIEGHHLADLPFTDIPADPDIPAGRWVLLRTDPTDPAMPARRHVVRLIDITEETDRLNANVPITRLTWEEAQALPVDFDLASLSVEGNLVPITAGETLPAPEQGQPRTGLRFATGAQAAGEPALARSVERRGPNESIRHFFTLPGSERAPITRLGNPATPELAVTELAWNSVTNQWDDVRDWDFVANFLGTNASLPTSHHVTLDDAVYAPIAKHWRDPGPYQNRNDPGGPPRFEAARLVHYDLDIGDGATLRFPTGEFGRQPSEGTAFAVHYRLGGGRVSNVAVDTVTEWPNRPGFVAAVTNPLPTTGGRDPETAERIRRLAPSLYKALTYRAVRDSDYQEAAERLDWVAHAGARFRHTGSWQTVFATADPKDQSTLPPHRAIALDAHLELFRQTGRPVSVVQPRYADIDLNITVCVARGFFRGDVKARVLTALFGDCDTQGFLSADNFTFGTALYRSQLEAVIQNVEGVRAVEDILIRRRGSFDWTLLLAPFEPARGDEIIRIAGDPAHPEWGFVILTMEGGS